MQDFSIVFQQHISKSIQAKQAILHDSNIQQVLDQFCSQLVSCFRQGGALHLCGNGGSAADAQHIAAEFSGRYLLDRQGINAEALHTNSSAMTAIANDFGYQAVYARLLQAKGKSGDFLIAISTSGNSPNILQSVEMANQMGIDTLALTGAKDSRLKELSKYTIQIPSDYTPTIQECHIMIGHIICHTVEHLLSV